MDEYKPREYSAAELTKKYVETRLSVEGRVNYSVFGPLKVNGLHRVFALDEKTYTNGTWFFITGTGLKKVNKDFFEVVFQFFSENQDDFKYLVFSEQIKHLEYINFNEDVIVCHKSRIDELGVIFGNTEELFNKLAEDVKVKGNDLVLHYYIMPW